MKNSTQLPLSNLIISIFLALLFSMGTASVQGQTATTSSTVIVYKDFLFLNAPSAFRFFDYDPAFLNDYGYAIALHKRMGERKFRQYEIKLAPASGETEEWTYQRNLFQLNYRRGKYWKKTANSAVKIRHGYSVGLQYIEEDRSPLISSEFPLDRTYYDISIDYILGAEFFISETIRFDIGFSPVVMSFGTDRYYNDNPALTERQKTQGGFDFDLVGQRTLKIGLGITF